MKKSTPDKCEIFPEFNSCMNNSICKKDSLLNKLLHHYVYGETGYNDGIFGIIQKKHMIFK
jgi:hypothetical protein